MSTYSVNQHTVDVILGWIKSDNIAIPEMQRPFVWSTTKVRDLMDSLYRGFPVGYLITWNSQTVPVKGGGHAGYQQILIDGQQRTTALRAAVAGEPVMDKNFQKKRIIISFNPLTEEFATATPFIKKNAEWIYDIHEFLQLDSIFRTHGNYLKANPGADPDVVAKSLERLMRIKHAPIGIISLSADLEIETVTEIFVRINSKGVPLSSSDFVMSKVSAYGEQGRNLRKLIDYFAHLAVSPQDYETLAQDEEFAQTPFWSAISWLKSDAEDLYDPTYVDIIRVASMLAFRRGRISFVVRELSGLNPETRAFEPERIPAAYDKFEEALLRTVNKYNFKKFLVILKSCGFISPSQIVSVNAINFAYALFLIMRAEKLPDAEIASVVRRWFVMSVLTARASGSFETTFERDLARISRSGASSVLEEIEQSELSDTFWKVGLPQRFDSSSVNNPQFRAFLAAQVQQGHKGFLSKHATVQSMIETQGDIHHLVPKDYLRKNGVNDKRDYNQVANYVFTETGVNLAIKNMKPGEYMTIVEAQISGESPRIGEITDRDELLKNMHDNAVPANFADVTVDNYAEFLAERRQLMSLVLRDYYRKL